MPDHPDPLPADAGYEDVLVAALDALERHGSDAVQRLLDAHPGHATRLRSHLSRLNGLGMLGPDDDEPTPTFPERLGDFRLLQRLGGGGMGVVYLARQESLGRTVALKLVRSEQLFFPGARERFRREVDAIAKLQHPGIVPIHAAGEDAGVPWLAMEHIVGASLDAVLRRLAGREPATLRAGDLQTAVLELLPAAARTGATPTAAVPPLFTGTWVNACLRIARATAMALQHAHERGVLHRDIKPSNIMLTPDGRALLLDFGLAVATGDARLTGSGSTLGTPAYMSPEQMRGEARAVDARSDVYSLAITLYELLTLRMPYAAESTGKTRELVLAGRLPPVREHNRAIPNDVEIVLRKACDLDRDRRYEDASRFAADLDNLLELRPITAQATGALLYLRRWAQRHPARAIALVAGLLLFLVTPTMFLLQQQAANRDIQAALDAAREQQRLATEASRQAQQHEREAIAARDAAREQERSATVARDQAQQQRDLAREVVDTMLRRVAEEQLLNVPRLQRVRRDLLASAKSFYERFLADDENDLAMLEQTARATLQMVFVDGDLGRVDEAHDTATRAIELARRLVERRPGDAGAELLLADALMTLGRVQQMHAEPEPALTSFDEARQLCLAVQQREPGNARAIVHLLGIERGASLVLRALGREPAYEASLRTLAAIWERHGAITVDDDYREAALDHVLCSGVDETKFLLQEGRIDEARAAGDRTAALAAACADEPLSINARMAMAAFAVTRAQLASGDTRAAAMEAGLHECLRITDVELRDNPEQVHALRLRAYATNSLGLLLLDKDEARKPEAMTWFDRSLQTLRDLVATDPTVVDNRANLAATLVNVGSEWKDSKQPQRALELFTEAEALALECTQAAPDRANWRTYLYNAIWFTGQTCGDLDDHLGQVAAAQRLVALRPDHGKTLRIAAELTAHAITDLLADVRLPPGERQRRRGELEQQAMQHLQQAAANGCTDHVWLRDSTQFAPLRLLPGFAELLAKVEQNAEAARAADGK